MQVRVVPTAKMRVTLQLLLLLGSSPAPALPPLLQMLTVPSEVPTTSCNPLRSRTHSKTHVVDKPPCAGMRNQSYMLDGQTTRGGDHKLLLDFASTG
jgi:hypothetical protein